MLVIAPKLLVFSIAAKNTAAGIFGAILPAPMLVGVPTPARPAVDIMVLGDNVRWQTQRAVPIQGRLGMRGVATV